MKEIRKSCFMLLFVWSAVCFGQQRENMHYYMMDIRDKHELPAEEGRTYVSSDEKTAVIKGNRVRAVGNGDCIIYAVSEGKQSEFAHITVGWPVQNPVLPYSWKMYIPDCEAHRFGDKLYVSGSLDASDRFCSPYITPVITSDLKHWESRGMAFSSFTESVPNPGKMLWGSDIHFYDGKYGLYGAYEWSGEQTENNFYVVESDSPVGPFKNFRWVTGSLSKKKIDGITPKILVENGIRYIIWAPTLQPVVENYLMIAKLAEDDVIDESSMKNLGRLKDFYEGPSIRKRGDTYYLVYDENCGAITDRNHTPKRLSYATSKNITGEYVYRGVILTIEDMAGNVNIQGSMEELNGEWYIFYHRAMNGIWNKRSLCVEKISFDGDGLIKPVVPTSSGIAEGLNTSFPIWFNTAVFGKNYTFTDEGKYGNTLVNGSAEIGFRYIFFTGKEKQLVLQGSGLENITSVRIIAGGKTIGERTGNGEIILKNVPKGKAELTLAITSTGETRLETLRFLKH
jgi:hypothetical protein